MPAPIIVPHSEFKIGNASGSRSSSSNVLSAAAFAFAYESAGGANLQLAIMMGIGQACVGQSIVWILFDGLLKTFNAFAQTDFGSLVPEVTPLQIKLIRFYAVGETLTVFLFLKIKLQAQTICNLSRFVVRFRSVVSSMG